MPMYGRGFTPADIDPAALTASEPVAAALSRLEDAYARWKEAADRLTEARRLAEAAPDADIQAALVAVSEGTKLPPPTSTKAVEAVEEAERITAACVRLAVAAEEDTRGLVEAHRQELRAAQSQRLEAALDRVDAAISELSEAMTVAGQEAARLIQVGHPDSDPLTRSGPMRWTPYDSRADANIDAHTTLDIIARYSQQMRPDYLREREVETQADEHDTGQAPAKVRVRT